MLYKCYSRLTRSRNLVQLLQAPQALYFLAWGSFLPSYDPSHCPLTLQGHKDRYSHCLAALEPHWGYTTKILKSSSNGHFSFDSTALSVPQSKMLKIPHERAAQCACAGTYRVCIALTQPAQQIFEKSRSAGRHMSSKAGKGLMKQRLLPLTGRWLPYLTTVTIHLIMFVRCHALKPDIDF